MRKKKKDLVEKYLHKGYTIAHDSNEYITLEKSHRFSIGYLILWTILANVIGFVGYLIYHAIKKEKITIKK